MCRHQIVITTLVLCFSLTASSVIQGQVPDYADLFNPLNVLNLNLEMDPVDWETIRADNTYSIHRPAYFWADGENKIIVDVKRKPTEAFGGKVSLKIDINDYFDDLQWHGVKKLSLENGADTGVVKEGLAWYLHRQAVTMHASYTPPLASWVNVTVNGQLQGVYTNVEEPDKTFLRNHDLWVPDHSWLYKQGDQGSPELVAGSGDSPTYLALNYSPFSGSANPPPGYETQIENLIDMRQMLIVGAANAFTGNQDELFTKGKNFFFADFDAGTSGGKRLHFPWDLDSVFSNLNATVYGTNSAYQVYILGNPVFHDQYSQIMLDLLDGPLSVASLNGFLDELETALTPSLLADPNGSIGSTPEDVAGHFNEIRQWITLRHAKVLQEVQSNMGEASSVPEPSTIGLLGLSVLLSLAAIRKRRIALPRVN
ncbi:MAG TPA: hypothetical protein DD670_19125 [Planctomycetaceae bacterium]|nr:hypothetical protein [Planctomycetaceae bacterium]